MALSGALALGLPAGGSAEKSVVPLTGLPSCSTLPRALIGNVVHTGPLALMGSAANVCTFTWQITGYYNPMKLIVQFLPYVGSAAWKALQSSYKVGAASAGAAFGVFTPQLFFTSKEYTSAGMPACNSTDDVTKEAGPQCAGQPPINLFTAAGYGTPKPRGVEMVVSAQVTGKPGTGVHLSGLIALVTQILSGRIPA